MMPKETYVEVLPLAISDGGLGPCLWAIAGPAGLLRSGVGLQRGEAEHDEVLGLLARLGADFPTVLQHGTSFRDRPGGSFHTWVAVAALPPGRHAVQVWPDAFPIDGQVLAELGQAAPHDPTLPALDPADAWIIAHGCRHLAWLYYTDRPAHDALEVLGQQSGDNVAVLFASMLPAIAGFFQAPWDRTLTAPDRSFLRLLGLDEAAA